MHSTVLSCLRVVYIFFSRIETESTLILARGMIIAADIEMAFYDFMMIGRWCVTNSPFILNTESHLIIYEFHATSEN